MLMTWKNVALLALS